MRVDIARHKLLNKSEIAASRAFARTDGTPSATGAVDRAFKVGHLSVDGKRIRLPFTKLPRGKVTSQEVLDWWISALNGDADTAAAIAYAAGNDVDAAERELAEAGLS